MSRGASRSRGSDGKFVYPVHPLDYFSKRQRHVVRSAWSGELFNLIDTADMGLLIRMFVHEAVRGVSGTAEELLKLRSDGGFAMELEAAIECRSILSAFSANAVKVPTERGTLPHVQLVRELTDRRILTRLSRVDTRDMVADALTKGRISREEINKLMNVGIWRLSSEALTRRGTSSS